MAKTPSKPAEVKPAPAEYPDTLNALDQIEAKLKAIVIDLDRHAKEASDRRDIAALHRAHAISAEWIHGYDAIRHPRHNTARGPNAVTWCGEPLLPAKL